MALKTTWNWQQPDWPNWRFDASALAPLEGTFLHQAGQLVGATKHLGVSDQTQLSSEILSEEAVRTSLIEGEVMDRAMVQSSVRYQLGLVPEGQARPAESGIAELMVLNHRNFTAPLSRDMLFLWHRLVCQGNNAIEAVGDYRQHAEPMQVVSGIYHVPKIHFEAPPSASVPSEMDAFIAWYNACDLPALTRSALAHLYFVSIHPFEDGNGRIARTISEKALSQALGHPSLASLSREIERNRKGYYDALEANNKSMDVTPWLSWFAKTVLDGQRYSIALIDHLAMRSRTMDRVRNRLNPRQLKAVQRLFDAGPDGFVGGMSAKNYQSITGASPATASRDLAELVTFSVIHRTGEKRGTRYWLGPTNAAQ